MAWGNPDYTGTGYKDIQDQLAKQSSPMPVAGKTATNGVYDYASDMWWGKEYQRALANGQVDYAASLRARMDANPHPFNQQIADDRANTAGMILARHLGGTAEAWMNGADGYQVNALGQIREYQPVQDNITGPGTNGNLYTWSNTPIQQTPSRIVGQAKPTQTQAQYAQSQQPAYSGSSAGTQWYTTKPFAANNAMETTKPLATGGDQSGTVGGLSALAAVMHQLIQQQQQQGYGSWGGSGVAYDPNQFGSYQSNAGYQLPMANWGGGYSNWGGSGVAYYPSQFGSYQSNAGYWPTVANWSPSAGSQQSQYGMQQPNQFGSYQYNAGYGSQQSQYGMQQPNQFGSYQSNAGYQPPVTNWGSGYGSQQSQYGQGPLSQMYQNGWGR